MKIICRRYYVLQGEFPRIVRCTDRSDINLCNLCLSVSEIIIGDRACTVGCCVPEADDLVYFNSK